MRHLSSPSEGEEHEIAQMLRIANCDMYQVVIRAGEMKPAAHFGQRRPHIPSLSVGNSTRIGIGAEAARRLTPEIGAKSMASPATATSSTKATRFWFAWT